VALGLAAIDASRHGDKLSAGLMGVLFLLNIAGATYLSAAVGATVGPGGRSAGAPSPTVLIVIAVVSVVASPPVTAILYELLRDLSAPRLTVLGAQAVFLVIAPLVVAPPWIVFNPANGAPVLSVSAPNVTVNCAQGQYPPITLKNAGAGTLRWTSFAAFNAVTINPASGSLGPGATQTITLSGAYKPASGQPQQVGVEFDSNGGSQRVTYNCQGASGAIPLPAANLNATSLGVATVSAGVMRLRRPVRTSPVGGRDWLRPHVAGHAGHSSN
jgi:hypothetical protein